MEPRPPQATNESENSLVIAAPPSSRPTRPKHSTRPAAAARSSYLGSLVAAAGLAALVALLITLVLAHGALAAAASDPAGVAASLGKRPALLAATVAIPLTCGLLAAVVVWRATWVARIAIYLLATQRTSAGWLRRHAPVAALGAPPLLRWDEWEAQNAPRPAHDALAQGRQTLLLGEAGMGKTTALHATAAAMSGGRAALRATLGGGSLPTLVSLPGLARSIEQGEGVGGAQGDGPVSPLVAYLAERLRERGTPGLATRAERLLRAGRLTLLCDGYDLLSDTDRDRVNAALAALTEPPFAATNLVVACDRSAYDALAGAPTPAGPEGMEDEVGPLAAFARAELAPTSADDLARVLRRLRPTTAAPSPAAPRPLTLSLGVGAVAAALVEARAAGQPQPWGRAEALRVALSLASAAAQERDLADALTSKPSATRAQVEEQPGYSWAALAASLREARAGYLPLDPAATVGECAARWLAEHPPLAPTDLALAASPTFTSQRLERDLQAGFQAGVVLRGADGLTLSLANALTGAALAAWWLDLRDDGLGRLSSQLLRPHWALPVALWAGASATPSDLAQRLLRFGASPDSVAPRAGLSDARDVYPVALALALAAALEGATPQLARMTAEGQTHAHAFTAAQQGLRDLLDNATLYVTDPERRLRLRAALRQVERAVGAELLAYVDLLIREQALDRLLRAQLILLLGASASVVATERLVALLTQSDPTLRQAIEQALAYAGSEATQALQRAARGQDMTRRRRAEEALRLLGDEARTGDAEDEDVGGRVTRRLSHGPQPDHPAERSR